jgi:hypothetical protein
MKILNLSVQKMKFIFSIVFTLLLIYGKAHGSFASSLQYSILKNKAAASALIKKIDPDKDDGDDSTASKRKSRGIGTHFFQTTHLSFGQLFTSNGLIFTATCFYCSLARYTPGKRGPPLA